LILAESIIKSKNGSKVLGGAGGNGSKLFGSEFLKESIRSTGKKREQALSDRYQSLLSRPSASIISESGQLPADSKI